MGGPFLGEISAQSQELIFHHLNYSLSLDQSVTGRRFRRRLELSKSSVDLVAEFCGQTFKWMVVNRAQLLICQEVEVDVP